MSDGSVGFEENWRLRGEKMKEMLAKQFEPRRRKEKEVSKIHFEALPID